MNRGLWRGPAGGERALQLRGRAALVEPTTEPGRKTCAHRLDERREEEHPGEIPDQAERDRERGHGGGREEDRQSPEEDDPGEAAPMSTPGQAPMFLTSDRPWEEGQTLTRVEIPRRPGVEPGEQQKRRSGEDERAQALRRTPCAIAEDERPGERDRGCGHASLAEPSPAEPGDGTIPRRGAVDRATRAQAFSDVHAGSMPELSAHGHIPTHCGDSTAQDRILATPRQRAPHADPGLPLASCRGRPHVPPDP